MIDEYAGRLMWVLLPQMNVYGPDQAWGHFSNAAEIHFNTLHATLLKG